MSPWDLEVENSRSETNLVFHNDNWLYHTEEGLTFSGYDTELTLNLKAKTCAINESKSLVQLNTMFQPKDFKALQNRYKKPQRNRR